MTLGEWPEGVEPQWQIPPEVFASECAFPRFHDRAIELGLDAVGMLGGSITEDFDRDGDIDIVVSAWGLKDQIRYFRNNGNGSFEDKTVEAGLGGITSGINLIHADYDNDGLVDILVLRGGWIEKGGHYPNSLLRNLGDGRFADVTQEAGLLSMHPTQTAAWADFDRDGLLDLFIGNETWPDDGRHACELYRNKGDGTFTECAMPCGIDVTGIVKGVTAGDYDNDGWSDIYISRFNMKNILLKNLGAGKSDKQWLQFRDVSKEAKVQEPVRSFPTWFWDFDNDGWLDIFVGGFWVGDVGEVAAGYLGKETPAERPRLYRNQGDGTFEDVSESEGIDIVSMPMGANYGDLDNDGWLDFYLGTGNPSVKMTIPNRVFRNDRGKQFLDVTTNGGFGHLQKGHGVSFADIDNDGDQDLFTVLGGAFTGDVAFNALYENPGNSNHWLTLRLIGTESNRDGIGARVKVELETPDGERNVYVLVGTGGSFGASSLQQEIGLGNAINIKSLEIRWPSTENVQRFDAVPMDTFIEMKEGETFYRYYGKKQKISQILLTIVMKRQSAHVVWDIICPLFILVSMVWSIFWMDIESLADRLNISFIGILTIVAYQFLIIDNMPRISYLTFTDSLLLFSFVIMSATVPQSLYIHSLVRRGKQAKAQRIDRMSRWAFPVFYLVMALANYVFYIYLT